MEAKVYVLDVPYHADIAYSYYIPPVMEPDAVPGSLVEVPFGAGNRRMTGVIYSVEEIGYREGIKPISSVIGDSPILNGEMMGLCLFVKDYTLCTFGEAMRAAVPTGALARIITYYRIIPENERNSDVSANKLLDEIGEPAHTVYSLAARKPGFTKQYLTAELETDCSGIVEKLIKVGLCEKCTELKGSAKIQTKRIISLSDELVVDEALYESSVERLTSERSKNVLKTIRSSGSIDEASLSEETGLEPPKLRATLSSLEKKGFVSFTQEETFRNHFTTESLLKDNVGEKYVRPVLSEEQSAAYNKIKEIYEAGKPAGILLHGVTGSGKTNVIMEAIDRVLEDGRGVIMLVPEIALTPQTVGIFVRRYGDSIAVIHSGLSAGERYDAWRRIRDGIANVVVGTRSAVFAPLRDIGLIIIDEEQEYTYKSDTNPKYLTHDIARYRCRDHNAVMLLASATPSLTSYHKAVTGGYTLIELKQRYGNAVLPEVKICDMRDEVIAGNLSPVSSCLANRLRADKESGNQSILFLNRRGYNNYVACRSCGKSLKCPHCSVTLTYHAEKKHLPPSSDNAEEYEKFRRENGYLTCHMCGYRTAVPQKCPECGKEHFMFVGCGTQKAEDDITTLFPDLRVLRMDYDTTQAKYSHEEILAKFRAGDADVLLGTQMVTKGHDFPKVATVGVLNADGSFAVDDYRANERTFAMLTQVIGRAGRGDIPGTAVIQTYCPDNDVLTLAAKQDYVKFYNGEIKLRKALCYPPFCDIAVITLSSADEGYLGMVTKRMHERIIEHTRDDFSDVPLVLFGPFEAPVYKVQNLCRMRLVMKCRLNRRTREFISELMREFGKSAPVSGVKGQRGHTRTDRRISVSVDLNPSTV